MFCVLNFPHALYFHCLSSKRQSNRFCDCQCSNKTSHKKSNRNPKNCSITNHEFYCEHLLGTFQDFQKVFKVFKIFKVFNLFISSIYDVRVFTVYRKYLFHQSALLSISSIYLHFDVLIRILIH